MGRMMLRELSIRKACFDDDTQSEGGWIYRFTAWSSSSNQWRSSSLLPHKHGWTGHGRTVSQLHGKGRCPAKSAILHWISSHLRSGLQISKWNDFFVDKKLDGLLLPVIHVAVQFVSVHSCRDRAKPSSFNAVGKGRGRRERSKGLWVCSHLLLARGGRSSVPDRSVELSPCSDGTPPSWPCACPPAPTHRENSKKKKTPTHQKLRGIQRLIEDSDEQRLNTSTEKTQKVSKGYFNAKRPGQTLEALDWLRRSFCSKILEYFFRSFLIIWKKQRKDAVNQSFVTTTKQYDLWWCHPQLCLVQTH